MANKNGGQTLGLTTNSRLWVTSTRPTQLGHARRATAPFSLALAGQGASPLRINLLLASRYGRNFILAKRVFFLIAFAGGLELLAQNALLSAEGLYLSLATTSPHTVLNVLLALCPTLWACWYFAAKKTPLAFNWLGGLTLSATSVLVMLFRTLPLEDKAFTSHAATNTSTLEDLTRFANVKNPLTGEKIFVVATYKLLGSLAKLQPGVCPAPDSSLTAQGHQHVQLPAPIFLPLAPFQLKLSTPQTIVNWPEIISMLSGQGTKTALLLFQGQSAHASGGPRMKNAPLWHAQKLPRLTFATSGVASVVQGKAFTSLAGDVPAWLLELAAPQATFALRDRSKQSLRFDLLQPLPPHAARLGGARPRARRFS